MDNAPLTKKDLDLSLGEFRKDLQGNFQRIDRRFENLEATMTENTKDIISHFNTSQVSQNERMDQMDAKLDAIIEMVTMRKELRNLIRELRGQGLKLDESKIFVA